MLVGYFLLISSVVFVTYFPAISTQGNPVPVITDVSQKPLWNQTQTDRLKRALLLNYDKFARPAQHTNTTSVSVGMTVRHVELDEIKSLFQVHAWTRFLWKDEKLKWNSSDYDGLNILRLADHEVWQPDIILYNSASGSVIDHYGNTHLLVFEDGSVLWVPPSLFNTFCELDLTNWPFDTQTCSLKLGSWTHDGNLIDLKLRENSTDVNIEMLVQNNEWTVKRISKSINTKYYSCCVEPYPDVTFNITITRNSPVYRAIVITPAFVVMFLILASFWLPPQSGEKILLNGCVAIIIAIFLLYFSMKLPPLKTKTPLIVMYYSSCLNMVSISMIMSVIVIYIARTKHTAGVPWFIKGHLNGRFGKLLNLDLSSPQQNLLSHRVNAEELREHINFDENVTDDHQIINNSTGSKRSCQQDWLLLATAIDRITFVIYSLIFVVFACVYSI